MSAAPPTAAPPAPPAPRYAKGSKVEYKDASGVWVEASVDTVAVDDALVPYYEITLAGGGGKSTVEARLRPACGYCAGRVLRDSGAPLMGTSKLLPCCCVAHTHCLLGASFAGPLTSCANCSRAVEAVDAHYQVRGKAVEESRSEARPAHPLPCSLARPLARSPYRSAVLPRCRVTPFRGTN